MVDLVIIDQETEKEIDRFAYTQNHPAPQATNHVWVTGNGDQAYVVQGVEHDFRNDEVRVICEKAPNKDLI